MFIILIIEFVLFIILTPGILVRLPRKGSKFTVAIIHGILFASIIYIIHWYLVSNFTNLESFKEGASVGKLEDAKQAAKAAKQAVIQPAKPATTKPATTKPATTQPATTKPATTKPATTKPK